MHDLNLEAVQGSPDQAERRLDPCPEQARARLPAHVLHPKLVPIPEHETPMARSNPLFDLFGEKAHHFQLVQRAGQALGQVDQGILGRWSRPTRPANLVETRHVHADDASWDLLWGGVVGKRGSMTLWAQREAAAG